MYTTEDGELINPVLVAAIRKSGIPDRRVVCLSGGERVSVSAYDAECIAKLTSRYNESVGNLRQSVESMWAQS